MFLLTSLLLGILFSANGCPLDPINCTIPYDDLNISSVVIIDATQYCHVDNCTVKIIETGDELNITYHNDQYHLSCTTTTLQLLEVNDILCEQNNNEVITICILDSIVSVLLIILNTSVLAVIIKQKKYSSLPIRLLLAATVVKIFSFCIMLLHSLTRFSLNVSNTCCIVISVLVSASFHYRILLELEAFIAIFHTFYRCHKLYPPLSEKTKWKLFWIYVVIAFFIIVIYIVVRLTIVVLLSASYLNSSKFCISIPTVFTVTPIMAFMSVAVFILLLKIEILFMILNGALFCVLSKNNSSSSQVRNSRQIWLIKITILLVCSSGVGLMVYYIAVAVCPDYSYPVAAVVMLSQRCVLLYILSNMQ